MLMAILRASHLDDLNGPTTALYGDQTYQLAAVWEDVNFDANFKDVGIGTHYDAIHQNPQSLNLLLNGKDSVRRWEVMKLICSLDPMVRTLSKPMAGMMC